MSDKRDLLRNTGLLSALTLLSRLTGLVRDAVIAALLGATRAADVFWIAFEIPNLARRVLGEGALSSFVVPLFTDRRQREGAEAAWAFLNRSINVIALLTLGLVAAGMLFASGVFHVFGGIGMAATAKDAPAPTVAAIQAALAEGASLTRLMFPYLTALAVASIAMGACHALGSFAAPSLGSVVVNLAMIVAGGAALFLGKEPVVAGRWLAVSVLAGALLRIVIMLPTLVRAGWRWRGELSPADPGVAELFRMMGAGLFGLSVNQINISIAGILATYLGEGPKTYLVMANRLVQFPMALTATAMAVAMLPQLSGLVLAGEDGRLRAVLGFAKRLETVLMTPAALGLIVFALPITQLVFERGHWSAEASVGTSIALAFYAPALLPWGWTRLIVPLYYARRDVLTPVKAALAAMIVNAGCGAAFVFGTNLAQGGLALASTLAAFANYGWLVWHLRGDPARPLGEARSAETLAKCALAAAVAVVVAWGLCVGGARVLGTPTGTLGRAAYVLAAIAVAGGAYFPLAHGFKVPDADKAWDLIRRRLTAR